MTNLLNLTHTTICEFYLKAKIGFSVVGVSVPLARLQMQKREILAY